MKSKKVLAGLLWFFVGTSLATAGTYQDLKTGTLSGKLVIQWLEPDVFIFLPHAEHPLKFVRSNGEVILPEKMLTDGGSVPRPMWAFRSYSPWGYAPAYIVHDWLFHMKKCKLQNYQALSLDGAGAIMGEVIKTMMESGKVEKDEMTVGLMTTAVTSRFAKAYWDEDVCLPVPSAFGGAPIAEYTLDFD